MTTATSSREHALPAPLLETKLHPPRPQPDALVRERLLARIDGSAAALTLVDAPVGFGKTMLAQSWCARTRRNVLLLHPRRAA